MTAEIWSWVGLYLLVGGAVLVTTRVATFFFSRETLEVGWGALALYLVKNAVSLMAMMVIWPVAMTIIGVELLSSSGSAWRARPVDKFRCRPEHLVKRVTILEAESLAQVDDPLHRVPNCPFGHLNKGWVTFALQVLPNDKLWSFQIHGDAKTLTRPGAPKWAFPQGGMTGYAVVRRRKIAAEFIYEWD